MRTVISEANSGTIISLRFVLALLVQRSITSEETRASIVFELKRMVQLQHGEQLQAPPADSRF